MQETKIMGNARKSGIKTFSFSNLKKAFGERLNDHLNEICPLRKQLYRDPLTQLWNRLYFGKRLELEIERAKELGGYLTLAIADVDDFKRLNDTYGHLIGDRALIKIAEALRFTTPEAGKVYPCRYGGEEIGVILAQAGPDVADQYGEQLCDSIRSIQLDEIPELKITASIGIYTVRFSEGSDLKDFEFISRADEQMYLAKRSGKNKAIVALQE